MRLSLIALAVLAAASAVYLRTRARYSSFGSYSQAQLTTLERGYRSVIDHAPASGSARPDSPRPGAEGRKDSRGDRLQAAPQPRDEVEDARISLSLLREEERRRELLYGALALGAVSLVGAFLVRRSPRRHRSDEEGRFQEAVGSPALVLQGERQKAAQLLGVMVDAPPSVVEAALAAQLASRDPSRMEGLAPDLRRLAAEQRESLIRARDLLVGQSAGRQ